MKEKYSQYSHFMLTVSNLSGCNGPDLMLEKS